ncbi:uncharacterized protein LOC6041687 [Culex quinquefasciatus]|uniref:uncharacterized protein LOC6041687 n=1 Tax=Culex quinquefasciatus TaxID=7176 RepID=UPI0018E3BC6A|nr:uncharacterized protein LOC6041687 [Culex quinquefasciatus]XP_038122613.1 uncharacterized protein LOC6041687 [Culex quinquefasciatus]
MDKIWITFVLLIIALIYVKTNGQSVLDVQLSVKKYVERGSEVGLYCENNAAPDILYKVTFLKGDGKIFEYIKGRNPPYRNYSIPGAEIDWKKVTPSRLMLKNVDYEASGSYYCEVSTDTPIFTKASNDEPMHVMLPQKGPPSIEFAKNQLYYGDMLVANCTTSRARPAPHITWLINGKQVDESHVRQLHHSSKNSHRSQQSKSAQLALSPQTAPSYVSQSQSVYHGRVIPSAAAGVNNGGGIGGGGVGGGGGNGGSGGHSLKELKAKARAVDDELKAAKAAAAAGGQYGGGGGFQIQPNIGYNSFDGGYGFGMKMHHRERSGGVNGAGSNIGVFNIGGDRMGDEADEDEESEKKTFWQHGGGAGGGGGASGSSGKGDNYHNYYDNNGKQQQSQSHFDNFYRKHRNSYEHKFRRHVNDATSGTGNTGGGPMEPRKVHRVSASYSQLSIRITEALTNNLGRIEITCLATIPAHVEPGAEYADYKTSLIKLDIEQNDLTSPEPSTGSLAHAKSDAVQTSNFQAPASGICRNLLAVQCGIVLLLLLYQRRSAAGWFLVTSLS